MVAKVADTVGNDSMHDHGPSLATAQRWITEHFGAPAALAYVGEGEDFRMFRDADGDRHGGWAWRFPKDADVVPYLRAEVAILPRLQHLPLEVPLPERVAEPRGDQRWPFVGYRWLAGAPADTVADLRPEAVLDALHPFLDAVHAIPRQAPYTEAIGWPLDLDQPADHPVARDVRGWLEAHPLPPVAPVFSHQDLGLCHLIVRDGALTGVLDWGDMAWGDPAADWGGVLERWPDEVEAFLADDPATVGRAWTHALRFALADVEEMVTRGPVDAAVWQRLAQTLARAAAFGRADRVDEFSLRPLRPTDDPAVADLIRTVMPEFGATGDGFAITDPEVDAMHETYHRPRSGFWVVCRGDRVVGGGGFGPLAGADPDVCELRKMYFRPEARGRGLGAQLLGQILEGALSAGYRICYLETLEHMHAARKLYERFGFAPLDGPMGDTGHHGCNSWYARPL